MHILPWCSCLFECFLFFQANKMMMMMVMICDATDDVNVSEAPCLTSSNQHMTEFRP